MSISVILIPHHDSKPLQTHHVDWNEDSQSFAQNITSLIRQPFYLETPLLRPRSDGTAGLYAYHNNPQRRRSCPNVRATRLAMACGLFAHRFWADVLIVRSTGGRWQSLAMSEIHAAATVSFDLRRDGSDETPAPEWLLDAARQNYQDGGALQKIASVMMSENAVSDEDEDEDEQDGSDDSDNTGDEDDKDEGQQPSRDESAQAKEDTNDNHFIAKATLCLHCRGPSSNSCACDGAYFCAPPASCQEIAWAHRCQCDTWKIYTSHRTTLSTFHGLGDWQRLLVEPQFQVSEQPYSDFLLNAVGVKEDASSWWTTEMGGWSGGQSTSASTVDATRRLTYREGFSPIKDIPPQRRPTQDERSADGTLLQSWQEYYELRKLSPSSPVALLCTFPLTIYYGIMRYAQAAMTVSQMLRRSMRVHVVGAEKELNFLDLFAEVGFLLPEFIQVELVFIVREDMLPDKCKESASDDARFALKERLTDNLRVGVVAGTYGDSLDPNFDVGSGPPDVVMALNAGLFAYPSWRTVVTYLHDHPNVVGVFTDYNEYSGVNCASLGGPKSRESLEMNPFRQPRAMPVYSMNLPQFSNGFFYVFNEQEDID